MDLNQHVHHDLRTCVRRRALAGCGYSGIGRAARRQPGLGPGRPGLSRSVTPCAHRRPRPAPGAPPGVTVLLLQ
eukprot:161061-Hanusia_phi.AAC.1